MSGPWFDALARRLGEGTSRRMVLGAGLSGFAGLMGGTSRLAAAQGATPVATPDTGQTATDDFLFVQIATGGTWAPKPGEPDVYLLTLTGASAQTIFFSNRPAHLVGTLSTTTMLEMLGFTPADPPNAAIVTRTGNGEDILVVELFNPTLDEGSATLTYEARILASYSGDHLAHLYGRQEEGTFPPSFGDVSLFIDDANCPNTTHVDCNLPNSDTPVYTYTDLEECLDYLGDSTWDCFPCEGAPGNDGTNLLPYWSEKCNADVAACNNQCSAGVYGG